MSTPVTYLRAAAEQALLGTELNALANDALALGSEAVLADAGYLLADLTLVLSYAVAPSANAAVSVWLLRETDGTSYEDGGASVTPARPPDVVFPLRAVTGSQRIVRQVMLPPGKFKPLAKNDGAGQALAASGNTLKLKAYTVQQ